MKVHITNDNRRHLNHILAFGFFPVLLLAGIGLQQWLITAGISLLISTYLPLLLGACMITWLEVTKPFRPAWQPTREDVKTDLLFMACIQIALPKLLQFTVLFYLVKMFQQPQMHVSLWPHEAPIVGQVVLMLIVVEFFRYWLHRWCHVSPRLWILHSIHHAPKKLYWLNVGRFHPLEKVLQFSVDALPFILLGVNEQVLALYFLIYGLNGFVQHSNLSVSFGPLNYVFSTAELHRWHHSINRKEANQNFGNNLILWDLVFGSFFLPHHRQVGELGIEHPILPPQFGQQMIWPFQLFSSAASQWIIQQLTLLRMAYIRLQFIKPLFKATHHPKQAQSQLLAHILNENQKTPIGLHYQFSNIHTVEQFLKRVPIQTYETLLPYIDKQIQENTAQLTRHKPIMYAQTSGTTGIPKRIPITKARLTCFRKHQNLLAYQLQSFNSKAFSGYIWGVTCPAIEGYLDNGIPYGSASGLVYQSIPAMAKHKYIMPSDVFSIADYEQRYLIILRIALAYQHVSCLTAANPSTFVRLQALLNEHRAAFIADIEANRIPETKGLSTTLKSIIERKAHCSAERKNTLLSCLKDPKPIRFEALWPDIETLVTWTGGSCGIALAALKAGLPGKTTVVDLGYLSTEFTATITADLKTQSGIPTLQDNFFEFIEKEQWENKHPTVLGLHQLEIGEQYYVLVTNNSGLYRYFMNDIIEVCGRWNNTPTLKFVQKGKGVTSITGEKLYESHVIEAVNTVTSKLGLNTSFFIMLADSVDNRYRLMFEPDSRTRLPNTMDSDIDAALSHINIEYNEKRASGRLLPLIVTQLHQGTSEQYKRHCLSCGQREGQFKIIALQYRDAVSFSFESYTVY